MVTVLLAHESRLVRQALAKILSIQEGISVVGHAETGPDTIEKIYELKPDVLVLNASLPELGRMLKAKLTKPRNHSMVVTPAGAPGRDEETRYVDHDDGLGELISAVINAGGKKSREEHSQSKSRALESLTSREREILKLVAEGLSNRQISHGMKITERTVKYHISNILRKLDLFSRTEAAILFLKGDLSGGSVKTKAPVRA